VNLEKSSYEQRTVGTRRMAVRMMLGQGSHFLITMTGVAVSVLLIALLLGCTRGPGRVRQATSPQPRRTSGSAGQQQQHPPQQLIHAGLLADQISGIHGAQEVTPVLRILTSARTERETMTLFLFGVDPASASLNPSPQRRSHAARERTLIVDQSFARKHGLDVCDELLIQDRGSASPGSPQPQTRFWHSSRSAR